MFTALEELLTLRSQSAVKIPPSNLAKGSTLVPNWSSQNTVLSGPLKASERTLERVEDIWSTLKKLNETRRSLGTNRQWHMHIPQVTRLWSQIEDKLLKYLGEYWIWSGRQQCILEAVIGQNRVLYEVDGELME